MKVEYDFSNAQRGAVIEPAGKTRITFLLTMTSSLLSEPGRNRKGGVIKH